MKLNHEQHEVLIGLARIARMRAELERREALIVKAGLERGTPVTRMADAAGMSRMGFRYRHDV